jgi:hypothetical protein
MGEVKLRKKVSASKKTASRLLVMLFVIILALISVSFVRSDYFKIGAFIIEGVTNLTDDELIGSSGLKIGMHILDFNKTKVETAITSNLVSVKKTEVHRKFPNTVRITVTERMPILFISQNNLYYSIDSEHYIISEATTLDNTDCIVINGLKDLTLKPGDTFDFRQNAKTLSILKVFDFLNEYSLNTLVSEIYVSEVDYHVYMKNFAVIKFFNIDDFVSNEAFLISFIKSEQRRVMVEVIENKDPIFKKYQDFSSDVYT